MNGETGAVLLPTEGDVLSSEWLSSALEASDEWQEGQVCVVDAVRVGESYGFSGCTHRLSVEAASGLSVSLVVKQEMAEGVERELLVRRQIGDRAHGTVPRCYIGIADNRSGRRVLVFEDIAPAGSG